MFVLCIYGKNKKWTNGSLSWGSNTLHVLLFKLYSVYVLNMYLLVFKQWLRFWNYHTVTDVFPSYLFTNYDPDI